MSRGGLIKTIEKMLFSGRSYTIPYLMEKTGASRTGVIYALKTLEANRIPYTFPAKYTFSNVESVEADIPPTELDIAVWVYDNQVIAKLSDDRLATEIARAEENLRMARALQEFRAERADWADYLEDIRKKDVEKQYPSV